MAQIFNYNSNSLLSGTGGDDLIVNHSGGSNVTIDSRAGNDEISNWAGDVTINSGSGNDLIENYVIGDGGNVKIDAGTGDDSIDNGSKYTSIVGGEGNDSVLNGVGSDYSTINTGAGDDLISLISDYFGHDANSVGNIIIYKSGDGKDKIYEFDDDDTLSIDGGYGMYSSQTSGDDIIVTVGDGEITLVGATNLDKINIAGMEIIVPVISEITLSDSGGTISSSINSIPINGGAGNDSIENYGDDVTISGGAGNDYISNVGDEVLITGGDGKDTISNNGLDVIINAGTGNDSIVNSGLDVTINGGDGNDDIYNDSDWVTINGGSGNDTIWNEWGEDVSINGGTGNDSIVNWGGSSLTINGGAGADLISFYYDSDSAYVSNFITDYAEEDTIKIEDVAITSITKSGKDVIFEAGNNTLNVKNAANKVITYIDSDGTKKTYGGKSETNSWTLDETTATYGTSSNTLITVTGVKSLDGISLSGKVVTIAKASVNAKKITISGDGYTLALNSNVPKPTTTAAGWTVNNGTATYKSSSKTAGYTLASDSKSITYSKATTASTLATVTGVASGATDSNFYVSGKVITIGKAAIQTNGTKLALTSGNYTLKLGKGMTAPTTTAKGWTINNGTATYKSSSKTAGYTLAGDSKSITYSKATTASTLATVTGVASGATDSNFYVSGKTITIGKAAVQTNGTKLTLTSGNYTLKFGKGMEAPTTTAAGWTVNNGTATYKSSSKTAGYSLASDSKSITYSKATTASTLATVTGVASGATDSNFYVSGKVITIGKAAIQTNGTKLTLTSGNYTLKLGKGMTAPTDNAADWILNGTTATYKSSYKTAGYTLASDSKSITYSKATTASTLATIKGVTSTDGLTISGKTIKPVATSLSNKVTVSGSGYTYDFAAGYKNATITGSSGNDTITARGSNIFVNGGKGNDTLKLLGTGSKGTGGGGSDVFVYYNLKGENVITDYAAEDKISLASGTAEITTNGDDVIFTVGSGKISVTGGKDKEITYIENGVEKKYTVPSDDGVKFNATSTAVTLTANYSEDSFNLANYPSYANTVVTIDAAEVTNALSIIANKKANKITGSTQDDYIDGGSGGDIINGGGGNDTLIGGTGNDSLNGGAGNDSLWGGAGSDTLFGGAGKDTFIFKSGDSDLIIEDYNYGVDKIVALSGEFKNQGVYGNDIVFTLKTDEVITLKNTTGSAEILDGSGNVLIQHKG